MTKYERLVQQKLALMERLLYLTKKLEKLEKGEKDEPYVYIASGWFNEEQERTRLACLNVLKEFPEIKIFSPKDEVICPSDADQDFAETVYRGNVEAIRNSTFMVCNTTLKDMGTLHESGVAAEAVIPIIYYAELPKGTKFNLMLARSGVAVATNPDELRAAIQHFKDNDWDFTEKIPYTGNIE